MRRIAILACLALAGCASVLGLDPLELGPNQDAGTTVIDSGTANPGTDSGSVVDASDDVVDAASDAADASDADQ